MPSYTLANAHGTITLSPKQHTKVRDLVIGLSAWLLVLFTVEIAAAGFAAWATYRLVRHVT